VLQPGGSRTGGPDIHATARPPVSARPPVRRRLALILPIAILVVTVLGATPAPAAATTTAQSMANRVAYLINRDRKARGLVPLRRWSSLNTVALERAGNMADSDTLSHDAAGGDVGADLTSAGIQWFGFGEIIGSTNASWGREAANYIYKLWKASSYHRSVMFSTSYNYMGLGFAHRASNSTTWASIVFTDSRDHTAPVAKNRSLSRSGTAITFSWAGHDRRLQRRTAGLKSFDVQVRRDNGSWRTIRDNTTSTKLTLRHRRHGHYFSFRVRSEDRRGNLSKWTTPVRVWVP
jgi:uncharacterized protein YkwD